MRLLQHRAGPHDDAIQIATDAVLDVYGAGLALNGARLTGTLQDGTAIDVNLDIANGGIVNLHNALVADVPAPATLGLMLIGLAALARLRLRRRA